MEVWGAFARLLALIYLIAFWSLWREIVPLCGARGLTPVAPRLDRMRHDYGIAQAILRHPTLLWLSASDRMLRALPIAGAAAAALAALGIASPIMLASAWLIYLSLDVCCGLTYPWESLLLEAGFLAIFLPPLDPAPLLTAREVPSPWLAVAYHWLLFRVMFGFGKTKFTSRALRDPLYLRAFLVTQPLPSPLGWRACRLPDPVLRAALALLFIVEMILPFFTFVPGWPRVIAVAGFAGLMVSIQLMGSFGFFNLLVIALSVTLFDPRSIADLSLATLWQPAGVAAAWTLLAGLVHLPFSTWVARGWPEWPAWGAAKGLLGAVVALMRGVMPFRTVHAYGVFPPQVGPPIKVLPVVEGSMDGEQWETFEYRYMPSTPGSPPKFVAPFCPRLDHFAIYDGAGVGPTNYLATIFSQGNPYDMSFVSQSDRLLQRLMEPDSPVRTLFARVPFDGAPPAFMRMQVYGVSPVPLAEHRQTGCYWRRELLGTHAPVRSSNPDLMRHWIPAPEQWHPDERWARRRVPGMKPLLEARTLDAVRAWLDPGARDQWDRFWNDVIPSLAAATPQGWQPVDDLAAAIESRFDVATRAALDRVRGAVTTALLERLDPHLLKQAEPPVAAASYFHGSLAAHAWLLDGTSAVDRLLRDPASAASTGAAARDVAGLMVMTVFRRQVMRMHARKHRLMSVMLPFPVDHPEVLPGFALTLPTLAAALPDSWEALPRLAQREDGNWLQDGQAIVRSLA